MTVLNTWQFMKGMYAGFGIVTIAMGITRHAIPDAPVPTYSFIIIGIVFIGISYIIPRMDVN